jgi:hypothetical protein
LIGVEYYLKAKNDSNAFILVLSDWATTEPYASFRVFAGNPSERLSEIAVLRDGSGFPKMWRARDGGTTEIQTEKGLLHVPTSFIQNRIAIWTVAGQPPLAFSVEDRDTVGFNLETLTAWEK